MSGSSHAGGSQYGISNSNIGGQGRNYPPYATMGNMGQSHLHGGHGSSYKELGPQNIFTTTQVAHHMSSSGMGLGGLGLAPGTHFGTSHLAAQNQMSSTSQHQGSYHNGGQHHLN